MLEKISAASVDQMLIKTASALRAQKARIDELETAVASYKRRDHAEKIASAAVRRGIMDVDEEDSYATELAKGNEDLRLVEEFVGRSAAGVPLGVTLEKTAGDSYSGGEGEVDVLTAFLQTSDYAG